MRVFVPSDSAALALGAEAVVAALRAADPEVTILRTGSRGMVWLEPLVEVEIDGRRHGFGPARPEDAAAILRGDSALALGPVDDLDWMRRQTRLTFARVGVIQPTDLAEYEAHGGLVGLRRALSLPAAEIVAEVVASGLRGRGGAGFPTGIKWKTVLDAPDPAPAPAPATSDPAVGAGGEFGGKYIVCNADEGDSGTFADRMLIEGDPFALIEGMVIAGLAVGARHGFVYLRSEYPQAAQTLRRALAVARAAGVLGPNILGSGKAFDIALRMGAGAYVCGEETALLNSLEGRRGVVRAKPPLPALAGFMGRPTVVNNVLTLATVPAILAQGPKAHARLGIGRSRGTACVQIGGNVARGGLFEAPFGITLAEVVLDLAGGTATGRPVKAVQLGGPLGAYLPPAAFDTPLGYEECEAAGGLLGHAGLVVLDETADMRRLARFAMEFCAIESCGKCTPCRIGAVRGVETIDRIGAGDPAALPLLRDLCETMRDGSLCALGGLTPLPVISALTHFPDAFQPQEAAR